MVMDDLIMRLRNIFSEQKRPAFERRRPVRHILFLTIPTGLLFSILNYLDGKPVLALIELAIMLGVLAPLCWVIRNDRYIGVGETVVMLAGVALFSALLVTGGKAGAGSSWIFVYPFLAFYINCCKFRDTNNIKTVFLKISSCDGYSFYRLIYRTRADGLCFSMFILANDSSNSSCNG